MKIFELNTRVAVKVYESSQDESSGKVTSSLTNSWSKWAKVEQTSGSRILDNASITYRETYTISYRYEQQRPTLQKYKIAYRNKEMMIHSVVRQFEGNAWYEQLICYTTI